MLTTRNYKKGKRPQKAKAMKIITSSDISKTEAEIKKATEAKIEKLKKEVEEAKKPAKAKTETKPRPKRTYKKKTTKKTETKKED